VAIASINQLIAGTSVPATSRLRRIDAPGSSRTDSVEITRRSSSGNEGVVAKISARGVELSRELVEASGTGESREALGTDEAKRAEARELRLRDREVRTHEQAHQASAGPHASSGPQYTYVQGPDGQQYASGGEVSIDVTPVPDDAQATILKMEQVRSAALAPADPSAQDRRVAAEASQAASKARTELREEKSEDLSTTGGTSLRIDDAYGSSARKYPNGSLLDLRA